MGKMPRATYVQCVLRPSGHRRQIRWPRMPSHREEDSWTWGHQWSDVVRLEVRGSIPTEAVFPPFLGEKGT